jgi:hypothetical protein
MVLEVVARALTLDCTCAVEAYPSLCATSGRGAVVAQNAEQPELARAGLMEALSADQGAVCVSAAKAVSPLLGAASYRHAVTHLLTSVARKICMLRSVGAGERATVPGHPVVSGHRVAGRDCSRPAL